MSLVKVDKNLLGENVNIPEYCKGRCISVKTNQKNIKYFYCIQEENYVAVYVFDNFMKIDKNYNINDLDFSRKFVIDRENNHIFF